MRARAVAVVIDQGELVVMRRTRDGSTYYTLPGGSIEPGEAAAEACVRELYEETGLRGRVVGPVMMLDNRGRAEHYFEVATDRTKLRLGGPEAQRMSSSNRYLPMWLPLADLESVDLRPELARQPLMRLAGHARRSLSGPASDASGGGR